MLQFANPWMLAALGAVAVPVLIHLLYLRRPRRTPWAAMAFLREAQQLKRRRVALQNILLLALRVLAVALLVLAFARPRLGRPVVGLAASGRGETALVVLLDDSASMGQKAGDSTAFGQAREVLASAAQEVAESGARASLTVWAASRAEPVFRADLLRPADLGRLGAALESLAPTALSFQPERWMADLAERAPRGEPSGRARPFTATDLRFWILTDLRVRDWSESAARRAVRPAVGQALRELQRLGPVLIVDAASDQVQNVGLLEARCLEPVVFAGQPARYEVRLDNRSGRELSPGRLGVLVDGQSLPPVPAPAVPAGAARRAAVSLSLDGGWHGLELRIEQDDALPGDNRCYLAARSLEGVRVLVVEGAAGTRPSEGAGYYVRAALDPGVGAGGAVRVDVRAPWALPDVTLSDYAAVVLCDVADTGPPAALRRYVEEGGGLIAFLGERTSRDAWNASLLDADAGVLPGRLGQPAEAGGDGGAVGLGSIELSDPLLEPFKDWEPLFGMVRVRRFWRLEPAGGTRVLARYGGAEAAPAILAHHLGRGTAIFITTDAGAQWTDWPRSEVGRVTWVPLLHRAVELAARARALQVNLEAGSPLRVELDPSRYERAAILRPPAVRRAGRPSEPIELRAGPLADAGGLWLTHDSLSEAGLWGLTLKGLQGGGETIYFAVNMAPGERDLERVPAEALRAAAQSPELLQVIRHDELGQARLRAGRRELWPLAAVLLLAVLIAESVLAALLGNPPGGGPPEPEGQP